MNLANLPGGEEVDVDVDHEVTLSLSNLICIDITNLSFLTTSSIPKYLHISLEF